jgi:hypothetical protein
MSFPSKTDEVKLTVEAEEPGTEIFLLDDQSRVIKREVGRLETSQAPGVYKIKIRAGYADREEILFLEAEPVTRRYPALPFYSPIPLDGTAARIESHVQAAQRLTGTGTPLVIGNGSRLFAFARDFLCGDDENQTPVVENPAQGLSLKTLGGETLVDLQEKSEVNGGPEPWAGCLIEVDPGSYVLSCKAPGGEVTEQIVYAAKGWDTQVFITQRFAPERAGSTSSEGQKKPFKIPDLQGAALLVTEPQEFRSNDPKARLAELARLNLSSRRQVLVGTLREMLEYKFEQPMLGIYGAHLLLLEKKLDTALFDIVIGNLRNLFADSHPDVEALSLATNEAGRSYVFNAPPMLRASWRLVVRASAKRPNLVPLGSLSANVADCVLGSDPWLTWAPPGQAKRSLSSAEGSKANEHLPSDLVAALEAFVIPYKSTVLTLPALVGDILTEQYPIYTKLVGYAQEVIAKVVHHVSSEYGIRLEHSAQTKSSSLKFSDEQIETLVEGLGLPRYNIEQLLNKNAPGIHAKLERLRNETIVAETEEATESAGAAS